MKAISELFEQEVLAEKLTEKLEKLAGETGGRVVLLDAQNQVVREASSSGLDSLEAFHDQIGKKLREEWDEVRQALVSRKQSFFLEGEYRLIVFWVPVQAKGQLLGGLIGYGGFFDNELDEEGKRKKKEDLYHLLDLADLKVAWEDYLKAADQFKFVQPDKLEEEVVHLASLLGVLSAEGAVENV